MYTRFFYNTSLKLSTGLSGSPVSMIALSPDATSEDQGKLPLPVYKLGSPNFYPFIPFLIIGCEGIKVAVSIAFTYILTYSNKCPRCLHVFNFGTFRVD